MHPEPISNGASWFSHKRLSPDVAVYTEPFLNDFFRANFYHLRGRDLDLLVDAGMGLAPLAGELDIPPGKPLLAVATHIHADHVGSLHEFTDRAGPRLEAEAFATMDDRFTFADMFRDMDDPVSRLPEPGWSAANYLIAPAALTRILDEGDVIDLGDRQLRVLHLPGHSWMVRLGCSTNGTASCFPATPYTTASLSTISGVPTAKSTARRCAV